jgi:hypothetical protein
VQNLLTEARSETSRGLISTASLSVETRMSSATACAEAGRRTASVTAAPAALSALAVSRPMPEAPPVTMARFPLRSTPSITSAAVELNLKFVVIRSAGVRLAIPIGHLYFCEVFHLGKPSLNDDPHSKPITKANGVV